MRSFKRLLILVVLGVFTAGCQPSSSESQVSKAFEHLEQAIENKNARAATMLFASGFRDQQGRDVKDIRGLMFLYFSRNKNIHVVTNNTKIGIDGTVARVQSDVTLLGTSNIIPERGRRVFIDLEWRKENRDWLLYRAVWESK